MSARVSLLFDDAAADLHHVEEWEALVPLLGDGIDPSTAIAVDFDERDFTDQVPVGARYVSPTFPLTRMALQSARTALRDQLCTGRSLSLLVNRDLGLWSRPGEPIEEFATRCRSRADEGEDTAAEKIRVKLESQRGRIEDALAKAEDRVRELGVQHEGQHVEQLVDLGTSLLGGLLGGHRRARSMAGAARRAAIEPLEVRLEKSDITVTDFFLVWMPVAAR